MIGGVGEVGSFFYSKTTRENYFVWEGANIFGIDPLSQKMMGRGEGL